MARTTEDIVIGVAAAFMIPIILIVAGTYMAFLEIRRHVCYAMLWAFLRPPERRWLREIGRHGRKGA